MAGRNDGSDGAMIGGILGGAAGAFFGPAGAIAGAGIGSGLGGYLSSDDIEYPGMVTDEDIMNLDPVSWRQMQVNKAQLQARLSERRAGMNQLEAMQMAKSKSDMESQQANRGLVGTSVGAGQVGSMQSQLQAQIAERAFQEENLLRQQQQQQFQNELAYKQAIRGQLMGQNQGQYQADAARKKESDALYSSLMNAGISVGAGAISSGSGGKWSTSPTGDLPAPTPSPGQFGSSYNNGLPKYDLYGSQNNRPRFDMNRRPF